MKKTVMAGPILGELGWLVFDLAPHVAGYFAQHIDDHKMVVCRERDKPFFPDADQFVIIPPELVPPGDVGRGWWTGRSREPIKKAIAWANKTVNPDEELFIPYFQMRSAEWDVEPIYRKLTAEPLFQTHKESFIVVAARQLKRGAKKNWSPECWDSLVRSLTGYYGMPVYAIGKKDEAYVPKGAVESFLTLPGSIYLLNNAEFAVTSNSGPTHLATMSGCPTFSWGPHWLGRRMKTSTNPLKTDVHFEGVGWQPDPMYIFGELRKWVGQLQTTT